MSYKANAPRHHKIPNARYLADRLAPNVPMVPGMRANQQDRTFFLCVRASAPHALTEVMVRKNPAGVREISP
jgi:hypothetical protein